MGVEEVAPLTRCRPDVSRSQSPPGKAGGSALSWRGVSESGSRGHGRASCQDLGGASEAAGSTQSRRAPPDSQPSRTPARGREVCSARPGKGACEPALGGCGFMTAFLFKCQRGRNRKPVGGLASALSQDGRCWKPRLPALTPPRCLRKAGDTGLPCRGRRPPGPSFGGWAQGQAVCWLSSARGPGASAACWDARAMKGAEGQTKGRAVVGQAQTCGTWWP